MQQGQCLKNVFAFLSKKGCSMILKPSKLWSTQKKSLIWAIEQVCTIKIVGSTPHFIDLGTQVPWSSGTQAGYLSFQWSKWAGEKNLRKNLLFLPTFVFWSISSDTQVPWSPWSPQGTRHTGGLSQLPVVEISWEKKSKKKPSVLTNFCFLVNFIRH